MRKKEPQISGRIGELSKIGYRCDFKNLASKFERAHLTPVAKIGGFVRLIGRALLAPGECSGHCVGD